MKDCRKLYNRARYYSPLIARIGSPAVSAPQVLECKAIADFVEARHSIPRSISNPARPAVFCEVDVRGPLLMRYNRISVYGVLDRGQQDAVVQTLKQAHEQLKTRRMVVEFYEKENWKTWTDPATGNELGHRGPETPLRTITVD